MTEGLDRAAILALFEELSARLAERGARAEFFYESGSLRVDVASPRYQLAMKLMSARPGADVEDIRILYRLCGFTTVEEGLDVVTRAAYPQTRILPKTEYLLGEIVEGMKTRSAKEEQHPA